MHYHVVVFGVKDTSENIIDYIQSRLCPVDLVITVAPAVTRKNQISGFKGLSFLTDKYGIPVHEADSYFLTDDKTQTFLHENTFDLGIVMGWQRLIPQSVLDCFRYGIYGFHGNAGYLPFGRGRSPLNWSMILGDTRFNLNLFRYDEHADSPNVFATEMFELSVHDDIRTAQYKNMICSKHLIARLVSAYEQARETGTEIPIRTASHDYNSWYNKRTPADGKIDWHGRTRDIYNLIRGVAAPFPGAFCYAVTPQEQASAEVAAALEAETAEIPQHKVTIWAAHPFDQMIDFHDYAPGEIIDTFDDKLVVRTVDGSMLIDRYESEMPLTVGMTLN